MSTTAYRLDIGLANGLMSHDDGSFDVRPVAKIGYFATREEAQKYFDENDGFGYFPIIEERDLHDMEVDGEMLGRLEDPLPWLMRHVDKPGWAVGRPQPASPPERQI